MSKPMYNININPIHTFDPAHQKQHQHQKTIHTQPVNIFNMYQPQTIFTIELEKEQDGRWIATVGELPGVMCYAGTESQATQKIQALTFSILSKKLNQNEIQPFNNIHFTITYDTTDFSNNNWLKLSESAFKFWDNEEDSIYDTL